jgi:hypothetical protein
MSLLLCFLSTVTASSTLCFSFSNSGLIGIDELPQADFLLFNAAISLNQFLTPNKEDDTLTRKKLRFISLSNDMLRRKRNFLCPFLDFQG